MSSPLFAALAESPPTRACAHYRYEGAHLAGEEKKIATEKLKGAASAMENGQPLPERTQCGPQQGVNSTVSV